MARHIGRWRVAAVIFGVINAGDYFFPRLLVDFARAEWLLFPQRLEQAEFRH